MKKMFPIILGIAVFFSFAGCTLDYNEPQEPQTEIEETTEAVTQKEELVPLLAEDEENKLYLYGIKPDGVILYAQGKGHYFDWAYACSDYKAPRLYKGCFDMNSTEDIAVVTYTKNDGVSVEDLRIISDNDFDEESVYLINEKEFNSYVAHHISYTYESNTITFSVGDINFSFDLSESFSKVIFKGVSYSENVSYEFTDGSIYVNIIPVVSSGGDQEDYGKTQLDMKIRAKLLFDGYNISLTEAEIEPILP